MKLILDDRREVGSGLSDYCLVRNYMDCVELLSIFSDCLEFVSLDYDLGFSEYTGVDVLRFMYQEGIVPRHINIHSDHPVGRRVMNKFVKVSFPGVLLTMNKID